VFPDNPYSPPRGSFTTPVPPPLVDANAEPGISLFINCDWLPYVRGALQQLLLQSTWKVDTPAQLLLAQQRAATLISLLGDCESPPYACFQSFLQLSEPTGYTIRTDEGGDTGHLGQFLAFLGYTATRNYVSGEGTTYTGIYLYRDFSPAVHLSAFDLSFGLTKGGGTLANTNGVLLSYGGSVYASFAEDWKSYPDGANNHLVGSQAPTLTDRIYMQMLCQKEAGNVSGSGQLTFKSFTYEVADSSECQQ